MILLEWLQNLCYGTVIKSTVIGFIFCVIFTMMKVNNKIEIKLKIPKIITIPNGSMAPVERWHLKIVY